VIRFLVTVILGSAAIPLAAAAQNAPATTVDSLRSSITGTVRDSLGLPVAGASVLIMPGGVITRTDSAGRFTAREVQVGALTIGLRKLGFEPLQSRVNLHIGSDLVVDLVMQRLPQMLAEVEVKAERQCPRFRFEGILCRQEAGQGFYMNRQEILEKSKDIHFARLLLRDAPGFRRNLNGNPNTVESITGWRCIRWIFDGGFPYSVAPIVRPKEVYAIEVYQPPDIPLEYRHQYWGTMKAGRSTQSVPCTLVVMWTVSEAQKGLKRLSTQVP
jgi:hypothetical protein